MESVGEMVVDGSLVVWMDRRVGPAVERHLFSSSPTGTVYIAAASFCFVLFCFIFSSLRILTSTV